MKKLLIILLAFVMIFSFTACGGGEEPAPQDSEGEESVEEGQEGEESEGEAKVYKVGTEPSFKPFEFTDDAGKITGFDIDLIKAIAADQGIEVEIENLGFDGLVMAVQSGNIDIVASGLTITAEREEKVDFSTPYITSGLAIAVKDGDDAIQSVDDLKGKKVAVQIGSTGAEKAQSLKDEGIIEEIVTFDTVDLIMMELINGGVDAVINDSPVTKAYMKEQADTIQLVGEPLTSESYGFAVEKGNTELLEMINTGLQNVIDDGTYDEIEAKYFETE